MVAAITAGILRTLVELTWDNPTASHAVGIPFVTLVLIYMNRDSIFSRVRPSPWVGGVIAVAGLALAITAHLLTASAALALSIATAGIEIGRASCRERGWSSVGGGAVKTMSSGVV